MKWWNVTFIRNCIIKDDVYRPHTYEEIAALATPEVAARLDPQKRYGVWWFNRRKSKTTAGICTRWERPALQEADQVHAKATGGMDRRPRA